ncbi:hypothetical protein STRCI_001293 [Streptomyces cinnabarinus]|uniref:Uncharacterized protein n=1 Tax=Streptomyces cinnabarinus TaxID=67287 RepID=A0ABY7KB77_9ACTN|nr:hypothetical protein [Streptomyces cinnabarinus]WAZ20194.1 hypothetical protein STRCI_001293 [Streptomyces cinnabarinus]
MRPVVCSFHIRTPAEVGQFRYDHVNIGSPHGDGKLHTPYPPQVGDLIHLWDPFEKKGGTFEVLARQWLHSSYGSTNWPVLAQQPTVGPLLDLIVQPAEGVFRNEAPHTEEDDDERTTVRTPTLTTPSPRWSGPPGYACPGSAPRSAWLSPPSPTTSPTGKAATGATSSRAVS